MLKQGGYVLALATTTARRTIDNYNNNQELIDKLSDYKMKDFKEFLDILYEKEERNGE